MSGSCSTADRAASETASGRTSSNWRSATCGSSTSTCRIKIWRISRSTREHFDDYVEAVSWAQDYARWNRQLMMDAIVSADSRIR